MTRITFALATALSLAFTPLAAEDFRKGWLAYQAGDYAIAFQELMPFAEAGIGPVQTLIGIMYENGQGVLEDDQEAVKWYRLAAEDGVASAQNNLGEMYRKGQGVLQDHQEALKWYRLAAQQGEAKAQAYLGLAYLDGKIISQDYAEANRWLQLAAQQGEAMAQGLLGSMYENGQGVLQNNVMAHMWYNIASTRGFSMSGNWRSNIAGLMTSEDISKAQAMARECMSSGYKNCGY